MAETNRDRVAKALELLAKGVFPFLEREIKSKLGEGWQESVRENQRDSARKPKINWNDPQVLLGVLWDQWNAVFREVLGPAERSLVSELRDWRNKWAHNESFTNDQAQRALDSMVLLLEAMAAPQADDVRKIRQELRRLQFESEMRSEVKKSSVTAVEGKPASGLRPWREIITPHPDVASGRYQQAEFAADLWQVYQGEGTDEYKHPVEFFRRTFITDGLRRLLVGAIRRLGGKGGDPVVELQTNFGGGKTHSMLALYHLFSNRAATDLPGVDALVKEAANAVAPNVKRVVLVGTKISAGQPIKKPDGTVVHTLWGEMAWQLGGKEGYKLVAEDDAKATNPGDALTKLFNKYAPCLILIDEWVAYARQLHERHDLPGGTFETQFTFAQALTESAKAAKQTLLVVSVPASESPHQKVEGAITDVEVGGTRGREALVRLKNAIGRVESSWRPASPDEGFEIVRRRLFQPIADPSLFAARDAAIRAFMEMYGAQKQEFPPECREMDYERRFKAAYPVHPELFDRLFNDWSTLERFQRTRGVLRLMAAVIHSLWERNDQSVAIMPAHVPVDDQMVQGELTRYLEDHWVPVIAKDVDGAHSLPLTLDRENPNFGKFSATRRVARTIYLGSAPTQKAANKGIDDRQVKLGCVQPGESTATFGDALRHLSNRATYLYVDGRRFWYSTQPTVTRLAEDRAAQLSEDDVNEEIIKRLRGEQSRRGDFARVHACPASSADVPDEPEARLVILGPQQPHNSKAADSAARLDVTATLESRGSSPRTYRNALAFVAADRGRLQELQQGVRQYLAWQSVCDEREALNLDTFQRRQADSKREGADDTVNLRIGETYQWLLVPTQPDPKGALEWTEIKLGGQDGLGAQASKKMRSADLLMVQMGGVRLRLELDRVPLWRGDHVGLKQLADDFAKYPYLPRLRDDDVLLAAVRDGISLLTWRTEAFAYAAGWDETTGRYRGLQAGQALQVVIDSLALLVNPDVAARQLELERQEREARTGVGDGTGDRRQDERRDTTPGDRDDERPPAVPAPKRRFHGTVALDPVRVGRDAPKIAQEVIQHLQAGVGTTVRVTLEIDADIPAGATEQVIRTVSENCRTLGFQSHGFEET